MEIHDFSLDHPQIKIVNDFIFRMSIFIPSGLQRVSVSRSLSLSLSLLVHLLFWLFKWFSKSVYNICFVSFRPIQAAQPERNESVQNCVWNALKNGCNSSLLLIGRKHENFIYLVYFYWNEKSRVTAVEEIILHFSYQK